MHRIDGWLGATRWSFSAQKYIVDKNVCWFDCVETRHSGTQHIIFNAHNHIGDNSALVFCVHGDNKWQRENKNTHEPGINSQMMPIRYFNVNRNFSATTAKLFMMIIFINWKIKKKKETHFGPNNTRIHLQRHNAHISPSGPIWEKPKKKEKKLN